MNTSRTKKYEGVTQLHILYQESRAGGCYMYVKEVRNPVMGC